MSNLKRYAPAMNRSGFPGMQIVDNGGYVKFEDIKHLLPTGAQQPQGEISAIADMLSNCPYSSMPECIHHAVKRLRKLSPHAAPVGRNASLENT